MSSPPGKLIILSGPSGVGKSTLVRRLLEKTEGKVRLSISATTRPARQGEKSGCDYYFLSSDDFESRRKGGEFLECFEVFGRGYWYGTLWSEVAPSIEAGTSVILEIDVDGAAQVIKRFPEAVTIFILPSSEEELARRLVGRGTESQDAVQRRLEVAAHELTRAAEYQHQIRNDHDRLDDALSEIMAILKERGAL